MQVIVAVILFFFVNNSRSLIVPDEVPTLLSLIYSNIPTLKKGTDSRLGWGFRLGDRADFQVLVELGPQLNTEPLSNQRANQVNKRNAINGNPNIPFSRQQNQNVQISETDGGKFIESWSKENLEKNKVPPKILYPDFATKVQLGEGEIDARDVIPDDSINILRKLYERTNPKTEKRT